MDSETGSNGNGGDPKRLLSKSDFTQLRERVVEEVTVPGLGGVARVQALTARERDRWERSLTKGTGRATKMIDNVRASLLAETLVDEKGQRLFIPLSVDPKSSDVTLLSRMDAGSADLLYTVAQRLNQVSEEDVEALKKGSGTTAGDDSSSS